MKNQRKQHMIGKNVVLLGTFLSASIVSSSSAWAVGISSELNTKAIDNSLDLASPSLLQAADTKTAELKIADVLTNDQVRSVPAGNQVSAVTGVAPALPNTNQQIAQVNLSDVAGNWSEPFINVLVSRGIIFGYPDGTFRPDQPVTRAEFAALLNRAFELPAIREGRAFSDVPNRFWAARVIDKAYRAGFLAGYPNNTFGPSQNIIRIESLVSLANGSRLQPDGSPDRVSELFSDAAQVPSYGRNALLAATQKCVTVSVSYPDGKTFNPNGVATRADVAAFIHQVLVASGRLSPLESGSPAQKYIVNCADIAKITQQDVLSRTGIGSLPGVEATSSRRPANAPVGGITTPSGFGADWGQVFFGAGYQENIPQLVAGTPNSSTALGAGIGLGSARDLLGLEVSYITSSDKVFDQGGVNFKLHKLFGDNFSVAAGWENAIQSGFTTANKPQETVYGVATSVFPLGETSNITASVGVGGGRFRTFGELFRKNDNTPNVFGSLGLRVSENIALAADFNGRNFNVGLPLTLKLSDNVGLQVTPSLLDIGGDPNSGASSRFAIGGGLGIGF